MAKKPTQAEVEARKKALQDFMQEHNLTTVDICSLINESSIRQISLRTVQCWVNTTDSPSSRTPPEDITARLAERLKLRDKAVKAAASAERSTAARRS